MLHDVAGGSSCCEPLFDENHWIRVLSGGGRQQVIPRLFFQVNGEVLPASIQVLIGLLPHGVHDVVDVELSRFRVVGIQFDDTDWMQRAQQGSCHVVGGAVMPLAVGCVRNTCIHYSIFCQRSGEKLGSYQMSGSYLGGLVVAHNSLSSVRNRTFRGVNKSKYSSSGGVQCAGMLACLNARLGIRWYISWHHLDGPSAHLLHHLG